MDEKTTNTTEKKAPTLISLADLKRSSEANGASSLENNENLVTYNPTKDRPVKVSELTQKQADHQKQLMDNLNAAIERTKKDLAENVIPKGREEIAKKILEAEEKAENNPQPPTKVIEADAAGIPTEDTVERSSVDESDDDLSLDEVDFDEEVESPEEEMIIDDEDREKRDQEEAEKINKQIADQFREEIKKKIVPIKNGIDLTKFTVQTKPMSYSKVMAINSASADKAHVSDWVLPNTGRSISIKEFSGSELEIMNPRNSNQNAFNTVKRIYSLIYTHVIDANKPKTLEEWLKGISVFDIPHLQFAVYKACFEGSNYLPYTCPNDKCNNSVLQDNKIEDMVKFGSDKVKEEFYKLFEEDSTSPNKTIKEELVQVSDKYVFGIKIPSIFNIVFESAVLDADFADKFAALLRNIYFINNIYIIDYNTNSLIPIEIKADANDLRKTVKNKIRIYLKIFRELNSEEYNLFIKAVRNLELTEMDVRYVKPAMKCEKCGTEIPEVEADNPLDLVFIRHQLTLVANS